MQRNIGGKGEENFSLTTVKSASYTETDTLILFLVCNLQEKQDTKLSRGEVCVINKQRISYLSKKGLLSLRQAAPKWESENNTYTTTQSVDAKKVENKCHTKKV